jgi:hypothetical protein
METETIERPAGAYDSLLAACEGLLAIEGRLWVRDSADYTECNEAFVKAQDAIELAKAKGEA